MTISSRVTHARQDVPLGAHIYIYSKGDVRPPRAKVSLPPCLPLARTAPCTLRVPARLVIGRRTAAREIEIKERSD